MADASSPIPNPANGDIQLAGNRVRGAVPSFSASDYVTRGELIATLITALGTDFLRRDGSNSMSGALNAGANKGVNFANGTAAGEVLTYAQAVLLAVTEVQTLAGKLRSPATVDGDNDLTLTTKAWVLAKIAASKVPTSGSSSYTAQGTYTFTLPTGVLEAWVYVASGKGGKGGGTAGALGGAGKVYVAKVDTSVNLTLTIIVGGPGGDGGPGEYDFPLADGGGAGGGGGSKISSASFSVSCGGGGGGGASNLDNNAGESNGGAGGSAGQNGDAQTNGGAAGYGTTENPGLGGSTFGPTAGAQGTATISGGAVDGSAYAYLFPGLPSETCVVVRW
jgi:hypothetical protein